MRKKWGNIVFSPNFSSENRGGHAIIKMDKTSRRKKIKKYLEVQAITLNLIKPCRKL